jgi:hypothetical protein
VTTAVTTATDDLSPETKAAPKQNHALHHGMYRPGCTICGAPPAWFYLVWRDGGGEPLVKYTVRYIAEAHARRLAKKNPGATFHVLKCRSTTTVDELGVAVTTYNDKWRPKADRKPGEAVT